MADVTESKVRITQVDQFEKLTNFVYYIYNGSDYFAQTSNIARTSGSGVGMWGAANNVLYWGSDDKFTGIGFRMDRLADVTGLQWQYSTGAAGWTNFTPFWDGTNEFTNDGIVAWKEQPDGLAPAGTAWTSHTHSAALPDRYWIRATISGHSAPDGLYLNYLRNLTLLSPIRLLAPTADGLVVDTAGEIQDADLAYSGPPQLELQCSQRATVDGNAANGMPNLTLLNWWALKKHRLFIEDLAQTATPDLEADSLYTDYTGKLLAINKAMYSPYKMLAGAGYSLVFKLQAATALEL